VFERHDIYFCHGWAHAALVESSGRKTIDSFLSYEPTSQRFPLASPGLALAPFPSTGTCTQPQFAGFSGDALICGSDNIPMQAIPLLSYNDQFPGSTQSVSIFWPAVYPT